MFKLDTNSYEYDYQISSAGNYENMQVLKDRRELSNIKRKKLRNLNTWHQIYFDIFDRCIYYDLLTDTKF